MFFCMTTDENNISQLSGVGRDHTCSEFLKEYSIILCLLSDFILNLILKLL